MVFSRYNATAGQILALLHPRFQGLLPGHAHARGCERASKVPTVSFRLPVTLMPPVVSMLSREPETVARRMEDRSWSASRITWLEPFVLGVISTFKGVQIEIALNGPVSSVVVTAEQQTVARRSASRADVVMEGLFIVWRCCSWRTAEIMVCQHAFLLSKELPILIGKVPKFPGGG